MQTGLFSGCDLETKTQIHNMFCIEWGNKFTGCWQNIREERLTYLGQAQTLLRHSTNDYDRRVIEQMVHLLGEPLPQNTPDYEDNSWQGGIPKGLLSNCIKLVVQTILSPTRGTIRLVYPHTDRQGRPVPTVFNKDIHHDAYSGQNENGNHCIVTFPILINVGNQRPITDNGIRVICYKPEEEGAGHFGKSRRRRRKI
jgi:hypothetical protein